MSIDPANLVTGFVSLGEWNTNGNFESWTTANVVNAAVTGGALVGDVNDGSNDPQLRFFDFAGNPAVDLDSGNFNVVEIRVSRTGNR